MDDSESSKLPDNSRLKAIIIIAFVLSIFLTACVFCIAYVQLPKLLKRVVNSAKYEAPEAGEYVILYQSHKQPLSLAEIIKILKERTAYKCQMKEWKSPTKKVAGFSYIEVGTGWPLMIRSEGEEIREDLSIYVDDKAISREESQYVRDCDAAIVVGGATGGGIEKLDNGITVSISDKYAPNARDTLEVVNLLLTKVHGIGVCNTDGVWIREGKGRADSKSD